MVVTTPLGTIILATGQLEKRPQLTPSYARTGGSIAEGALIGFGVGAVLGSTVGQEACLHSPRWHCAVWAGTMFAAIGAAIAWFHKQNRVLPSRR